MAEDSFLYPYRTCEAYKDEYLVSDFSLETASQDLLDHAYNCTPCAESISLEEDIDESDGEIMGVISKLWTPGGTLEEFLEEGEEDFIIDGDAEYEFEDEDGEVLSIRAAGLHTKRQDLLALHNRRRRARRRGRLRLHGGLNHSAQSYAVHMARRYHKRNNEGLLYWNHNKYLGNGRWDGRYDKYCNLSYTRSACWRKIYLDNYRNRAFNYLGENLGHNLPSAGSAVYEWMNSDQGHREILLDRAFNKVGFGFAYNTVTRQNFWVAHFGRRP